MRPLFRPVLALCVLASLGACSLRQDIPPVEHYVLQLPPPQAAATRRPETLRVAPVRVAPTFASAQLVYRLDEVRYVSDFYHRLMAPPGAMISTRTTEWLDQGGPLRFTAAPGSTATQRFLLDLHVLEFYGDFRPGQPAAAVLVLQASLTEPARPTQAPLFERTFRQRVALSQSTPAALVEGQSRALAAVLTELQPLLAASLPPP
jgi:uncharacterized lipoprotein YmbA